MPKIPKRWSRTGPWVIHFRCITVCPWSTGVRIWIRSMTKTNRGHLQELKAWNKTSRTQQNSKGSKEQTSTIITRIKDHRKELLVTTESRSPWFQMDPSGRTPSRCTTWTMASYWTPSRRPCNMLWTLRVRMTTYNLKFKGIWKRMARNPWISELQAKRQRANWRNNIIWVQVKIRYPKWSMVMKNRQRFPSLTTSKRTTTRNR